MTLYLISKFYPKWVTPFKNTPTVRKKVPIQPEKLAYQARYLPNLYQQF